MNLEQAASEWLTHQHAEVRRDGERRLADRLQLLRGALRRRRDDRGVVGRFADACPVAGASIQDYALREVDLGPDGHVMAGIHFYGMDMSRPFVGVLAAEHHPNCVERLQRMHRELLDQFAMFGVRVTRWGSGVTEEPFRACPTSWADQLVFAAPLDHILRSPPPPNIAEVTVGPASEDWYTAYSTAWERMMEASPGRSAWLHKSAEQALCACDALVEVRVRGALAGWFAAHPGHIESLHGYEMMEQFLIPAFQGRGLASAAQRRLCEVLEDPSRWLVGTIDAQNVASRCTALRNGRWCVDTWWFVGTDQPGWGP